MTLQKLDHSGSIERGIKTSSLRTFKQMKREAVTTQLLLNSKCLDVCWFDTMSVVSLQQDLLFSFLVCNVPNELKRVVVHHSRARASGAG